MTEPWNLLYFSTVIPVITWIALAIVHIAFTVAVYSDSNRRNTFLVRGYMWALATLLGGLFVVGLYWVIHHSSIRSQD